MFIDTHAHVNFKAFEADAEVVIKRALGNGVSIVLVGTQIDTSRQAVEMAEKFESLNFKSQITPPSPLFGKEGEERGIAVSPSHSASSGHALAKEGGGGVYAVVGLHPVHTYSQHLDEEETSFKTREEIFDYEVYSKIANHPLVVGIGECGLDYFRLPEDSVKREADSVEKIKAKQKDVFIQQIKLANELNKALVIHCRPSAGTEDAYEDILKILDTEHLALSTNHSSFRFEIHSFTGSPTMVMEFVKRGAFVGLNGIITFDKTGNMKQVVETVPLERIVLETDSPYLTPVPHRGKRNEPLFVKHVAEKVAEIKGVSLDEVEKTTTANARKLFKI